MGLKVFKILFIIADPQGDADVRQKLADVRTAVFEITTVETLAQALVLLQSSSFDVLLVNLAVADYRGIDSLRNLIVAAKEAPVIVVSSSYDEAQALEAVRAGAEDYTVGSRMNSAAFERVIMYSIERHLAYQKTALQFSVSRVLAESTNLHDAADGILGALCEFAKFERGEIWQSDKSAGRVVLLTSWPRITQRKPPPDDLSQPLPSGEDLAATVLRSCAPATLTEPQPAVAFPLSVGAGALGVLALFGSGTQGGDKDFAKLLLSVGRQLGQFMARKTAEEERESLGTERLIILDSTSEGIYGLDRDGCITFINKSASRILGCTPEQVLGKKSAIPSHPSGRFGVCRVG